MTIVQRNGSQLSVLRRVAVLAGALLAMTLAPLHAVEKLTTVRMTVDEDPIVMRLAQSLGYFREEGLQIQLVDIEKIAPNDFMMQKPLNDGVIDASYHWFHHTVFGARQGVPVKAVMVMNDAPGMTILVARRLQDQIRSAADFKGRKIASGAEYGTKSVLTHYLARKAGVPDHSYRLVNTATEGREEAVLAGLKGGQVDVMTFEEPMASVLLSTQQVSVLYDLNSRASTQQALGAAYPAQSLLLAPQFIAEHPQTVQHLVNALVRTMRYINAHGAEQIAASLPADYFANKDRATEIQAIGKSLPSFAHGDYSFKRADVQLIVDSIAGYDFGSEEEGRWRTGGDSSKVKVENLYDNTFVVRAMQQFK